jgi:PAS domain S-box-containing protein
MSDAASFDAIMQCNLLEVFCEALGAALFVTDKRDEVSFASVRLQHLFPIPDEAIKPGKRARDLYSALFDAGCRLGIADAQKPSINRDDWIAERVAIAWKERVDTIEQCGPGRWLRMVSRRFPSGLGLTILLDVSEHKKKENLWRQEQERVRLTEEVLDALPVAIAVKDRHLNFAAVNQRFCAMLNTTPEAVLGHGIWDLFEHDLATSLDADDRMLFASGNERQTVMTVSHPEGGVRTILHRARRIGKPGQPYLAMSFEEIPTGGDWAASTPPRADLALRVGAVGEQVTVEGKQAAIVERKRIVYVSATGEIPATAGRHDNADTCIVRNEAELSAFVPAARAAGLDIDLILIAADAAEGFAAIAKQFGIKHKVLGGDEDAMLSATPQSTSIESKPSAPRSQGAAILPTRIEILVVEDNPINQLAVEQIFGSLGLDYVLASNGEEGLARIAELHPSMIFADVTLPDMPFDAFAEQARTAYLRTSNKTAMIGLLSKSSIEGEQQCRPSDFADTIMKPLSPDAVDAMIRKHLFEFRNLAATSAKTAA